MKLFVNIGVLSALAVCALATGGGWQAESTGWRSGPSFTWKQGTHQVSGAVLDGRSPTTGWINPAVPSAVGGGGGGGGSDGGWQAAAPATHYSGPVSYAAPAPSAGSGWTTPIISHPKPVSYSGWQSPSAPVRVAAAPQPSAGYSVTWTAPAAPQRAIPVAITYGGGSSGSGQVWQMPVPASAGWTSVPVIMKSAGLVLGAGADPSQAGRWVQEDGRWVWETEEVRGELRASPPVVTSGWRWPAVTEEIRLRESPRIAPTGHAVSWSWSRRGRDFNEKK